MMNRVLVVALAIASVSVFAACSSSETDGTPSTDPAAADDSKSAGRDGGSTDATFSGDASLPPLPPAFAACGSCMQTTCEPQIAACDADPYCTQLLECSITSGCLATDPSSCVPTCAASLGLTKAQTVQETKLLTAMATSCASCLAECPKPDGG